jgi:hypothetical protein
MGYGTGYRDLYIEFQPETSKEAILFADRTMLNFVLENKCASVGLTASVV